MVIAGPNGAGKSTFFEQFLRKTGLFFVNADILARALAPEDPMSVSVEAARAADALRSALVEAGETFCTETVFSDSVGAKLRWLRDAQARGDFVRMIFIGMASPELSQARVVERVESGGHDVPDEKIFERYPRTLDYLRAASAFVDELLVFDNSQADEPFRLVARLERGAIVMRSDVLPEWLAWLDG